MISRNLRRILRIQRFHFSSESDTIYEKLIENDNISETLFQKDENIASKGPKWMRFFGQSDQIMVDINRSIKTENVEMFFNFLKHFNLDQLLESLLKMNKLFQKKFVLEEIRFRIIMGQNFNQKQNFIQLIESIQQFHKSTSYQTIHQFLVNSQIQVQKSFEIYKDCSFIQQNIILNYLFESNQINTQILEEYADFFQKSSYQLNKNLDQYNSGELFLILQNITRISKIVPKLDQIIDEEQLQTLVNKYVNYLENNKLSIIIKEKGLNSDENYQNYLLFNQIPPFIPQAQALKIKKSYIRIISEKLNEDNFGQFYSFKRMQHNSYIVRFLKELYSRSEREMVYPLLNQLVNIVQNEDQQIRNAKFVQQLWRLFDYFEFYDSHYFKLEFTYMQQYLKQINLLQVDSYMEFNTLSFYVGIFLTRMQCFNKMNYFNLRDEQEIKNFMQQYDIMMDNYLSLMKNNEENFLQNMISMPQKEIQGYEKLESEFFDEEEDIMVDNQEEIQKTKEKIIRAEKNFQIETQNKLKQLQIFNHCIYDQKYSQSHNLNLIWFTQILEYLGTQYLEELVVKNKISSPQKYQLNHEMISFMLNQFTFMPYVLENLIILSMKDPVLVGEENYKQIKQLKQQLDDLYNMGTQQLLNKIDQENQNKQIQQDLFYMQDHLFNQIMHEAKKVNKEKKEISNFKSNYLNIQPSIEEDFYSEKFVNNKVDFQFQKNLYKKALHSKTISFICRESQLKRFVEDGLNKFGIKYQKNYVCYPYYLDFMIQHQGNQVGFIVKDQDKLTMGTNDQLIGYFTNLEKYFNYQGIKVKFIDYNDYQFDIEEFMIHLKKQIEK